MSLSFWIRDYIFLPLAMIRREIWWRNAALIIAMVIFGLWHKASMLFVIWGCYHGVLLVLHRQLQQLHRKLNWQTSSGPLTFLSWLLTVAVISLGWIFFRANSVAQANHMFSATTAPPPMPLTTLARALFFGRIVSCWLRHSSSRRSQSGAPSRGTRFEGRFPFALEVVLASSTVPVGDDVAADDHSEPRRQGRPVDVPRLLAN